MRVALFHSRRRSFAKSDVETCVAPKNLYWGLYDLADDGKNLIEVFPKPRRSFFGLPQSVFIPVSWLHGIRERAKAYRNARAVFVGSKHAVYTVFFDRLLLPFLSKPSVIWIYAGYDEPWSGTFLRSLRSRIDFRIALFACDYICPETRKEVKSLQSRYRRSSWRIEYLPKGIDLSFYSAPSANAEPVDVLIIGNNRHRDWKIVGEVSQLLPERTFSVLSHSPKAQALRQYSNVTVHSDLGYAASRDHLFGAKVLWVPTNMNSHFSGMSTVMMGMAAGVPVLFDEPNHWVDFNLEPPKNCIFHSRGVAVEASEKLRFLLASDLDTARIGESGKASVASLGTEQSADALRRLICQRST